MHYLGTFKHTLDAKGRLFIPARFREKLGEEFVLFKSPDKCLSIYDNEEFDKLVEQVKKTAVNKEGREKARNFYAAALTVNMDKQGRFTVPQDFIDYASLGTDVIITGEANRLEVWRNDAPEINRVNSEELTENDFPEIIY